MDERSQIRPGPYDAITDVPGVAVGHWTSLEAATGCTVVRFAVAPLAAADVRGGAPGTRETDALGHTMLVRRCDAIVLSGGSAFGLASAQGAVERLAEEGRGFPTGARPVPVVPAAILYDLGLGDPQRTPGPGEGRMATRRAKSGRIPTGTIGAGTGATIAKALGPERMLKGGIGSASAADGDGLVVGAIVAVNAVGCVVDPATGRVVAGVRGDPGRFLDPWHSVGAHRDHWREMLGGQNTTIGVVATNAAVDHSELGRLAAIAHDGLARTILPAHTRGDGDTIFSVSTETRPVAPADYYPLAMLTLRAVECAVLDAVTSATGLCGVPAARDWMACPTV